MSQPTPDGDVDRSGSNPAWVGSLSDITPEDCHAYLDGIAQAPMKACEAPNCPDPPSYMVSFHGCTRFAVCAMHRATWASGLAQTIERNGSIACEVCNKFCFDVATTMQWRAI